MIAQSLATIVLKFKNKNESTQQGRIKFKDKIYVVEGHLSKIILPLYPLTDTDTGLCPGPVAEYSLGWIQYTDGNIYLSGNIISTHNATCIAVMFQALVIEWSSWSNSLWSNRWHVV